MQPSPETTLAMVLGASEYPRMPELSKEAFRHSAEAFRGYLLDPAGFALPYTNLLYLFDDPEGPSEQEEVMTTFLKARLEEMKQAKVPATDLIVYYVGHGTFVDPGSRYVLALKCMRQGREEISGFPMRTLANTIKDNTPNLRRYVILDCCFSATAFESFQSGPLEVALKKTQEYLPANGTALLCASGPRDPAKAPANLSYTMFSSVFLDILKKGATDLPEKFSMVDLSMRTEAALKERFTDEAVRPQLLSPDQTNGDIAKTPIFPNPILSPRALEETLSDHSRRLAELEAGHAALSSRLESIKARLDTIGNAPAASEADPVFVLFRFPWPITTGLTKSQWDALPGAVKGDIVTYKKRARNGILWALVCIMVSVLTISLSGRSLRVDHLDLAGVLAFVTTVICGLMAMVHFAIWIGTVWKRKGAPVPPESQEASSSKEWENYDVVVAARKHDWRLAFGLEIEKGAFSLSQLIYLVAFFVSAVLLTVAKFS